MILNKSKILTILLSGMIWVGTANAQQSVNASGNNALGIGGTVAYSIGQVFYTNYGGSTGSLAEGVQHPYDIFINETKLDFSLKAFPIPTSENLTLEINNYSNENLSYQLYDILGHLLAQDIISAKQTLIKSASLPSATYILYIMNKDNQIVQSLKIIKN